MTTLTTTTSDGSLLHQRSAALDAVARSQVWSPPHSRSARLHLLAGTLGTCLAIGLGAPAPAPTPPSTQATRGTVASNARAAAVPTLLNATVG